VYASRLRLVFSPDPPRSFFQRIPSPHFFLAVHFPLKLPRVTPLLRGALCVAHISILEMGTGPPCSDLVKDASPIFSSAYLAFCFFFHFADDFPLRYPLSVPRRADANRSGSPNGVSDRAAEGDNDLRCWSHTTEETPTPWKWTCLFPIQPFLLPFGWHGLLRGTVRGCL